MCFRENWGSKRWEKVQWLSHVFGFNLLVLTYKRKDLIRAYSFRDHSHAVHDNGIKAWQLELYLGAHILNHKEEAEKMQTRYGGRHFYPRQLPWGTLLPQISHLLSFIRHLHEPSTKDSNIWAFGKIYIQTTADRTFNCVKGLHLLFLILSFSFSFFFFSSFSSPRLIFLFFPFNL